MPPAIEIEALHKRYGDRVALDGVALTVGEGSVYGFLGSEAWSSSKISETRRFTA